MGAVMEWERVVFADELDECPGCGEPWCEKHRQHYADCACIGPHEDEDEIEFREVDGVLQARRLEP